MTITEKDEFIVVQRCKTYGFWPETLVESDQFTIDYPGEQTQTKVSICAEHYGNVEDHRQPPKPITTASRFAFGLSYPTAFRSGAEYYCHDEGMMVDLRRRFPFAGEVDIFLKTTSTSAGLPPDEIRDNLIQSMPALLLLMRMTTQDIIVPSWRLQTVSNIGGKTQQHSVEPIRIIPKEREQIAPEQISAAFKLFGSFLHPDSDKESILRLSVAARRIMNAYNETDLLDRFSDLWEACEMLSPGKKYKIDCRIAKRASDFTGFHHHLLKTRVVSKLYGIRKNIVHSYIEDLEALAANARLLFDLATILYASYFGFRYRKEGLLPILCKQPRDRLRIGAVIEPDRDRFLDAARRLAANDRNGLADPEDVAAELGIGLYQVTELVRRYQDSFDWTAVPIGKLKLRS